MHSTVLYFLIWNGNIYDHLFWFVIECAAQQYKDKEKKNLNHLFEPFFQALKVRTTRTTYCLHIGHSAICFPHVVQVHMCPHSSITQSTGLSMQILHKSESTIASLSVKKK